MVHYFALPCLKNAKARMSSKQQNQNKDHSGSCNPKIAGNLAEQSPSAFSNQGKIFTN
jgi:hypothetical protein